MISKERNYTFDFLRILACFLVIVNHTDSAVFMKHFPSPSGYLSLAYFFISKIAVPLFLMITGALLLPRDESYKDVFVKRVLRIIIALVVVSFLSYLQAMILKSAYNDFNLVSFFRGMIEKPISTPLWYLYMLLGLLICLPFLRKMASHFDNRDFLYFILLFYVFTGLLPYLMTAVRLPRISGQFDVFLAAAPLGYVFTGHFISNVADKQKLHQRKFVIAAWAVLTICILLSVAVTASEYYREGKLLLKLDNYASVFNIPASISVFFLFSHYAPKWKLRKASAKALISVSNATFGIYLFHFLVIRQTKVVSNWLSGRLNDLLAVILYEIFVFAVSFLITKLLQQVPFVKKLL